jgi:hypothetical protein
MIFCYLLLYVFVTRRLTLDMDISIRYYCLVAVDLYGVKLFRKEDKNSSRGSGHGLCHVEVYNGNVKFLKP